MNPRYRRLLIPGLLLALMVVVVVSALDRAAHAAAGPDPASDGEATVVARLSDPDIDESSGLAISRKYPGLAYTVDDSGSGPVVFVIDLASGRTVGRTVVDGAAWTDVEALALGPGGTLWIADTGDNRARRDQVALYEITEPGAGQAQIVPRTYPFTYATGPVDVEAFVVNDDSSVTLFSKGALGGQVFRLSADRTPGVLATAVETGDRVPGLVTDAARYPDGSAIVLRTYGSAVLLDPDLTEVASADLPPLRQGETIAVEAAARTYLIGSEGANSPLLRVPAVPRPLVQDAAGTGASSAPAPESVTGDPPAGFAVSPAGGLTAFVALAGLAWLGGFAASRSRRRP